MSVDLDIIPGSPKLPQWGQLRSVIGTALGDDNCQRVWQDIRLYKVSSKLEVQDNEHLKCPDYYYFGFAQETTLALSLELYSDQEQADYLDDSARGSSPELKAAIIQIWKSCGYLITMTSGGGRPRGELQIMAYIASCIAKLTKGYIVVNEDRVFQQPAGIYAPDEFISSNMPPLQ